MSLERDPGLRKPLAIAGIVAVGLAGAYELGKGGSDLNSLPNIGASSANADTSEIDCDTADFTDLSSDASKFEDTAFLPEAADGIDNADEAESYVDSKPWGNGDGIDAPSLAALESAITKPASDKKATDTSYDYAGQFSTTLHAYEGPGGLDRARQDCADTAATLAQTGEYNDAWAGQGEKLTRLSAVRNADNQIIAMRLKKVVADETIDGIEFELRDTSGDNLDGFGSVLVDEQGNMYVKGVPTPETNKDQQRN
jgi:hypothetical protein